jgi:WD40 repeat protein
VKRALIGLGLLLCLGACQGKQQEVGVTVRPTAFLQAKTPTPSVTPTLDLSRAQTATDWAQFQVTMSALRTEVAEIGARPTDTATPPPTNTPTGTPIFPITPLPTPLSSENTPVPMGNQTISVQNVGQVIGLARWGKGTAEDIAYSPDGSIFAVASSLGIYLYDSQQQPLKMISTDLPVWNLFFSADGNTLVDLLSGNRIEFRSRAGWKVVNTLDLDPKSHIRGLVLSPRGDSLGFIRNGLNEDGYDNEDRSIEVVRIADGKSLFSQKQSGYYSAIRYTTDGQSVYIADGDVTKYKLSDGSVQGTWFESKTSSYEGFNNLEVSPDEKTMVVSDSDSIYLWKLVDPVPYQSITAYEWYFSDGNLDVADTCFASFDGGGPNQFFYKLSPDGRLLALKGKNHSIQTIRLSDATVVADTLEKNIADQSELSFDRLTFHPGGKSLAVLYGNGLIEIRELPGLSLAGNVRGFTSGFHSLAFSPLVANRPMTLAVTSTDRLLRIWDVAGGMQTYTQRTGADLLAFSPSGDLLAFGSRDWTLNLLRISDGKLLGPLPGHQDWISGLAFSPDGKTLISASRDCTIKIWKVGTTVSLVQTIGGTQASQLGLITDTSFSPDGTWMIGITSMGLPGLLVYNTVTQDFHIEQVPDLRDLSFSPGGKTFAKLGFRKLEIWDFAKMVAIDQMDIDGVCISYAPDGRLIAVGKQDGTIDLLDSQTLKVLGELKGHRGRIADIQFSPDGRLLVSAAYDGTVQLWGVR